MKAASKPCFASIRQPKEAGFTLVELLIAIVILGILASLAVPSFREFVAGQRIKTASFDMMAMLTLARSEAIKRNAEITLSVVSGNFEIKAGTELIQKIEVFKDVTLTCKSGGATVACDTLTYSGNGRLKSSFPSVEISNPAISQIRCISIDLSGRPNTKNTAC